MPLTTPILMLGGMLIGPVAAALSLHLESCPGSGLFGLNSRSCSLDKIVNGPFSCALGHLANSVC